MEEDWDDSPAPYETVNGGGFDSEPVDTGRNFSRGRGFVKATSSAPGGDGGWGDDGPSDSCGGGAGGGRDGGRGRGGRGGRGGFRSRDDNDNGFDSNRRGARGGRSYNNDNGGGGGGGWGESNGNDDGGWGGGGGDDDRGGRGRGRGRGRGGRGGGRSFGDDDDNGGGWGGYGDDGGHSRGRGSGRGRGRGGGGGGDGGWSNGDGGDKTEPREFYIPPDPTDDMTEMFSSAIISGINFDKYDNIPIEVSGENVVPAIKSFDDSGLRPILIDNVIKSGYQRPTPIQKTAIPIVLAGRDVMACAQTGSGKTAAFLLPIINCLIANKTELIVDSSHCEPQVVIVSPTRELAIQIQMEARKFAYDTGIKTVVAYGGTAVQHQIRQLMGGCHILVATPGRMNDFVSKNRITFNSVRFVVLDEADRMLDMGFLPAVEQMLQHETMVPTGERQTLMFSATFPEEVQRLAANFLNNYLFITVGIVGGACSDVQQSFYQIEKYAKRGKLLEILKEKENTKTLVFVETKRNADFIATFLSENNLGTTSIHGDRLQSQREEALRDFKTGRRNILVATDVAARGLDIKNVQHVINFDLPKSIDEYVHRIGRTGRVGNSGKATSFFDGNFDSALAPNLVRILKQANQPVPDWLNSAAVGGYGGYNSDKFGGRDVRGDDFGRANDVNNGIEEPDEEW